MATTTHQIVFTRKNNECSMSAMDPHCPLDEFDGDLEATGSFIWYHDDWRHVSAPLYSVSQVELPGWLSPREWIRDSIKWKYTWSFGVDNTWPEAWQRELKGFSSAQRLAAVKLLKTKKFRSDFRASLCDRLKAWLETPTDDREYADPFSVRQWACLINRYVAREAEQLSTSIYRAR